MSVGDSSSFRLALLNAPKFASTNATDGSSPEPAAWARNSYSGRKWELNSVEPSTRKLAPCGTSW